MSTANNRLGLFERTRRMSIEIANPPAAKFKEPGVKTYRVGTLVYTRGALLNVFFWMLWGDLCLSIMEAVVPRLVPLQLKNAGASDALIGLIAGSIPSGMNFVMNPWISTKSDRHRGPLGRRMPFLLFATPLVTLFLILLGFSPELSHWGRQLVGAATQRMSQGQLIIVCVGVLTILFTFFNLFVMSVYYYLFTDVIPPEVMGRFTCLFRVVGAMGGVVFNRWILGYADHHSRAIYVGTGLVNLAAFMFLAWRVREGEYPPPPPRDSRSGSLGGLSNYFRESFSVPFYLKLFAAAALYNCAFQPTNTFIVFYATRGLGMSLGTFGKAYSWAALATVPLYFVLGPIIDYFHPLRVGLVGLGAMAITAFTALFFIHGPASFPWGFLFYSLSAALYWGANASMMPRLMPRDRYGQFCSANAMVGAIALVVAQSACGIYLQWMGSYRFIFLWAAIFSTAAAVMTGVVYKNWQALGGDESYAPPVVGGVRKI